MVNVTSDPVIDQILAARSREEMAVAEEAAVQWLEKSPGDMRVLAALESLETKLDYLRDPGLSPSRMTMIAFSLSFPAAVIVAFVYSVGWSLLIVIGSVVLSEIAGEFWHFGQG